MVVDGSKGEYEIIERGGIKLPKTRKYSYLGRPISQIEEFEKLEKGGTLKSAPDYLKFLIG
jgi:hypothetical protein